uniref:Uncharacterized protein n=1 Tax=Schlesneria paludicola TaxID=360056 RepID=A0A7C4LN99_9PLAN
MRRSIWFCLGLGLCLAAKAYGNGGHLWSIGVIGRQLGELLAGCPFCSAPSLTMAEQLAQSDAVLLVKWVGGKPAAGNDGGTTDFEIVEVVKQPSGSGFKPGGALSLVRYRAAKAGTLFLLLGTKGGAVIDWGSPLEVTVESFTYMKQAPSPDVPTTKRLKYFMKYLEAADQTIATDAYGEFANAPYADITPLAPEMPRENLRKWVLDPNVSPSRLGLYGLMLGLCGKPEDAAILEQKILEMSEDFRLGIDGVMGGYLLLTGEEGLAKLEASKVANKKAPFSETYAAMQALRFMWQYGEGKIPAERLRQSMRLFLERPELADLVIADLARMKDWSIQTRLMQLYGQEEYDIPSIKRAIVRFLLACAKDVPAADGSSGAVAQKPEHAALAAKYLAELEAKDPKTVADAKRFFFIK